jgi:hypothetical protein
MTDEGSDARQHESMPASVPPRSVHWTSPWIDRLHALVDSPWGAVLGGALYGSWAVVANVSHGAWTALRVGLIHFAMSTGLTFAGVRLMSGFFGLARRPQQGALLAACGSLATTYGLLIGVHHAIGTPEIFLTLLPGILPTLGFTLGYSLLLLRKANARQPTTEI